MEIIANNLPVQDLLRCRLVCKLWAKEMAQYLTKRKALVVAYEDCTEARELVRKKEEGKFVNISTLCILEIPITCQLIQDIIRNFRETLSGLKLDDCNPESKDLFRLLQAITSLEVLSFKQTGIRPRRRRRLANQQQNNNNNNNGGDSSSEEDEDSEEDDNQEGIPGQPNNPPVSRLDGLTAFAGRLAMPTVKKLCWEEMRPVQHVERIVRMFPNLEELELLCWSKPDPERMKGLKMDKLKQLTLSCDNDFSQHHFLALANLKLKLKKLTLHDLKPGGRRKMKGFKLFLESVAGTLQEMNLNGSGRLLQESMRLQHLAPQTRRRAQLGQQSTSKSFVRQSSPFPISFPQLQKLEIDCSLLTDMKALLEWMPRLEKLECKFQDWKGWWHLLNKGGVPQGGHGKLKELTLGAIDGGCLQKMVGYFAGVTRLDVAEDRIDDVAFRTICESMRQLSHLRITQSGGGGAGVALGVVEGIGGRVGGGKRLTMTDTGFTGVKKENLARLGNLRGMGDGEEVKRKVEGLRDRAYLGNLKNLYCLELAMSQVQMTDLSVIFGIKELKRISTITLPKCEVG